MLQTTTETVIDRLNNRNRELEKRCERLTSLISLSEHINSTLVLDELLEIGMELSKNVMDAEASSLMLLDEQTGELIFRLALGKVGEQLKKEIRLKKGQGIAGWVAEHGQSVLIEDVKKDSRFYSRPDEKTGFITRNMICCPLKVKGRVIGVTQVLNKRGDEPFGNDDVELFQTFSNQIAVAVENAKVHESMLEKQKMVQELELARTIQQSFLPVDMPEKSHFSLAVLNNPARNVSGDFYDFFLIDEEHAGFLLGDVSGKGVPAALYMANLISKFRCMGRDFSDIALLLQEVNNSLCATSKRGMFVTLIFVKFNFVTGQLQHYNAGHLPLFVYRRSEGKVYRYVEKSSVPFGILKNVKYEAEHICLRPGDAFFMCTDGITEARSYTEEEFGTVAVEQVVEKNADSAESIITALNNRLTDFTLGAHQHDDMTMLAVKWEEND